jgi:hypothetical protein
MPKFIDVIRPEKTQWYFGVLLASEIGISTISLSISVDRIGNKPVLDPVDHF